MQTDLAGFGRHPFYDAARSRCFLAVNGGEPCGRIVAIVNDAHLRLHGDGCGFFGFFECTNDSKVAAALFDAAQGLAQAAGLPPGAQDRSAPR